MFIFRTKQDQDVCAGVWIDEEESVPTVENIEGNALKIAKENLHTCVVIKFRIVSTVHVERKS